MGLMAGAALLMGLGRSAGDLLGDLLMAAEATGRRSARRVGAVAAAAIATVIRISGGQLGERPAVAGAAVLGRGLAVVGLVAGQAALVAVARLRLVAACAWLGPHFGGVRIMAADAGPVFCHRLAGEHRDLGLVTTCAGRRFGVRGVGLMAVETALVGAGLGAVLGLRLPFVTACAPPAGFIALAMDGMAARTVAVLWVGALRLGGLRPMASAAVVAR